MKLKVIEAGGWVFVLWDYYIMSIKTIDRAAQKTLAEIDFLSSLVITKENVKSI